MFTGIIEGVASCACHQVHGGELCMRFATGTRLFADLRRGENISVPFVFNGVLAVERPTDAQTRAGGAHDNKGEECTLAAIETTDLLRALPKHSRSTAA